MLILQLLKYVAEGMPAGGSAPVLGALQQADAREIEWALAGGLGPLLSRATLSASDRLPPELTKKLLSADLTAQVRHDCKIGSAKRVIDICCELRAPVILLKGISISGQCYPAGHLRPMSDIDILVPPDSLPSIEAEMVRRGFFQGPCQAGADFHHGEPLFDPERRVWVELHRALFPADSSLCGGRLFSTETIAEERIGTAFEERAVGRLSDELQLIYIASSWTRDLSMNAVDPTLVVPLADAVCLLRHRGNPLDWNRLFGRLDNPTAAASALILLAYLARHDIVQIPAGVLARLADSQTIVGRPEIAILVAMVHRYLVGGRRFTPFNSEHMWTNLVRPGSHVGKVLALPWNILFPPGLPERYDLAYQQRRIARWVRRARA